MRPPPLLGSDVCCIRFQVPPTPVPPTALRLCLQGARPFETFSGRVCSVTKRILHVQFTILIFFVSEKCPHILSLTVCKSSYDFYTVHGGRALTMGARPSSPSPFSFSFSSVSFSSSSPTYYDLRCLTHVLRTFRVRPRPGDGDAGLFFS